MMYRIPERTVVLSENEVNMDMYMIKSGHVELYKGYKTEEETLLGIMGKGKCFGEIGLLTGKPSIYTVVAYDDVELIRIPIDNFEEYVKENPKIAVLIMMNMAKTMYNLKFDIDLLAKEKFEEAELLEKKLLKYNMVMNENEGQ